ncbi:MAG TPA: PDZ domain-containing protein [Candidatus Eisenbacteria bacterium]|jgi:serine protease Do
MLRTAVSKGCGVAALLIVLGTGAARAATDEREAWLGVYSQTLTSELRDGLGYDGSGALVNRVVEGSPAERAGIRKGDVIVGIAASTIESSADVSRAVRAGKVGQTVAVRIVRDGQRRTLSARLAVRPEEDLETPEPPAAPEAPEAPVPPEPPSTRYKDDGDFNFSFDDLGSAFTMMRRGRLGVRVESLNPDLGSYFGVESGNGVLVVEVLKDTPAERAGLKAGDVITKVGNRSVEDAGDLVSALRSADRKATLTIVRKRATRTVECELNDRSRVMRFQSDGSLGFRDGDVRARRVAPGDMADMRRELDSLRRELQDLKAKLEGQNRN